MLYTLVNSSTKLLKTKNYHNDEKDRRCHGFCLGCAVHFRLEAKLSEILFALKGNRGICFACFTLK
jgi:hypothetical protein